MADSKKQIEQAIIRNIVIKKLAIQAAIDAEKAYLKKNFNLITGDNRDTIKRARRLLDEFITAYTAEEEE